MCGIRWSALQFDFGGRLSGQSSTEENCVEYSLGEDIGDYVVIPISSLDGKTMLLNRFCGQRLNPDRALAGLNADVICKSSTVQSCIVSNLEALIV